MEVRLSALRIASYAPTIIRMTSIRTTLAAHVRWTVAAAALALVAASVASAAVLPSADPTSARSHVAVVVAAGDPGAVRAARSAVAAAPEGELRVARSVTEQRSALIGLAEGGATRIVAVGLETPGTVATLGRRRPATRIVRLEVGATSLPAAISRALTP